MSRLPERSYLPVVESTRPAAIPSRGPGLGSLRAIADAAARAGAGRGGGERADPTRTAARGEGGGRIDPGSAADGGEGRG